MKILYFDCNGGVSGDMMLSVLTQLSGCSEQIKEKIKNTVLETAAEHNDDRQHQHHIHHGRSYRHVKQLIESSGFSDKAKDIALKIYAYIARAEASVHGETLETVHFHEVGRDEAIKNALGIGMAVEHIKPDRVLVSDIYDGSGTVVCSHGCIPVPVPAVMALRKMSIYNFRTAEVDTEMVTPSGLAALMGIGAEPGAKPESVVLQAEASGGRHTGRNGLRAYITIEG